MTLSHNPHGQEIQTADADPEVVALQNTLAKDVVGGVSYEMAAQILESRRVRSECAVARAAYQGTCRTLTPPLQVQDPPTSKALPAIEANSVPPFAEMSEKTADDDVGDSGFDREDEEKVDPLLAGEYEEVDFQALGIDPSGSTHAKPGTEAKILMLAARVAAGVPLWHDDDCYDHGPGESIARLTRK